MKLADLPFNVLSQRAHQGRLLLDLPPYRVLLRTRIPALLRALQSLYGAYDAPEPQGRRPIADFRLEVQSPLWRRLVGRPQVRFWHDDLEPFEPLPAAQAHPMFEWGLNYAIGNEDQTQLALHAGVVERNGRAVILSGASGSGKSTLTALLAFSGFRLLSDEMCLLRPEDGCIQPLPRPISLKNQSIDLIKSWFPEAVFSTVSHDTRKGSVAHVRPPENALLQAGERPRPTLLIFPRYQAGSGLKIEAVPRAEALLRCQEHAFNFHVQGERGYKALLAMVRACETVSLVYDDTDAALAWLREKTAGADA